MTQRILIADTETTGVGPDDHICELAFLEVDMDLNILGEFQALVKPPVPISPQASAASHITNAMVADAPTLEEAIAELPSGYFDNVALIGHNAQFDERFLKRFMTITEVLCTLKGARMVYPDAPDHKLQTLRYWLELEAESGQTITAHRAMSDVLITRLLLMNMTTDLSEFYHMILEHEAKPITVMPFGKHKGTLIKELPRNYVAWTLQNIPNLEPPLREALERRMK
jgi:exodeoxyribonuclease X